MRSPNTEAHKAAAADVLAAFLTARKAGRPQIDCYLAGVAAWRRHYPRQELTDAAHRAVAVILEQHIYRHGIEGVLKAAERSARLIRRRYGTDG
jgi:hypothetical protein